MNDHPQEITLYDGKLVLFQREDVQSAVWHARMSFPKHHKGYVHRSTNKTDLEDAKLKARNIADTWAYKLDYINRPT